MNIEEHIKNLKKYIEEDFAFRKPIKNMSDFDRYCWNHCKDIETLLTAYEKEKETVDKINKLNIPVDTLLAEFERLEDLEDDLTTVYLNGVYDGEKKVEDKIKAKVIEIKDRPVQDEFITASQGKLNTIIDMESLLEKE